MTEGKLRAKGEGLEILSPLQLQFQIVEIAEQLTEKVLAKLGVTVSYSEEKQRSTKEFKGNSFLNVSYRKCWA